jgi:hypothetical protein
MGESARRREMVIPIDTRIAELLKKRSLSRWTSAKVKRMSSLTRPADCELCGLRISKGEWFRDGGIHHRVHDLCAQNTFG